MVLRKGLEDPYAERRAPSEDTLDLHRASEGLAEAPHDRQAETDPTGRAGAGAADLPELVEDMRQVVLGDAVARVPHLDLEERRIRARVGPDLDPTALGELDGVIDEVSDDLLQLDPVGQDLRDLGVDREVELEPAFADGVGMESGHREMRPDTSRVKSSTLVTRSSCKRE